MCCFDKTGTLTTDRLFLEDVVTGSDGHPDAAKRVMATCHSLIVLNVPGSEGEIVGDPLEKAAIEVRAVIFCMYLL